MNKTFVYALMTIVCLAGSLFAWSGSNSNLVSDATNLPAEITGAQTVWELKIGSHQYSIPTVDGGQIFIGTNDYAFEHPAAPNTDGGLLTCLDQGSGAIVWQLSMPRNMGGAVAPFHFGHWKCGLCSSPVIDDGRIYVVGSRGDVLCVDRNGQADGNDGLFKDELRYMNVASDSGYKLCDNDGDIIWKFEMIDG